ncbi:MAG: GNAT family N-acetyltransferase [Spirochaetaceae bacterium]|jgi:tetratricopeptide (TPR) repeat protein|nr:GNAT family N-acetyltransferase [Spirochaetaceae bacterium]
MDDILFKKGVVAYENDELEKAEHIFSSIILLEPENSKIYNMRGVVYANRKLFDKAMADFTTALELNPQSAHAFNNLGGMYRDKKRYKEAIANFSKAIAIDDQHTIAIYNRGITYNDQGLPDEALADFNRVIKIDPLNVGARYQRGNAYREKRLFARALEDYGRIIEADSQNADAFYQRGVVYCDQGRFDKAEDDFNRWLAASHPEGIAENLIKRFNRDTTREGALHAASLIAAGFYMDVKGTPQDAVVMPYRNMKERSVLFFDKLHVGKTISRHIRQWGARYALRFDVEFDEIFTHCVERHGEALFTPAFRHCLEVMREGGAAPRPVSFALYKDDKLVAGDIGIQIGRVYTSYSGYYEKDEPSSGIVQLILMARHLEENGFAFVDFGPGNFSYKSRLGAVGMTHREYVELFHST